ncbi:MAG: glutathione peroxidase [Salinivirgaceae bacterium]|jgi:glutathione peroxidase
MEKIFITSLFTLAMFVGFGQQKNLHDFKTKTLEGVDFDLASLKGKKVLVVNTASKCGNTPQYAELEALYKKYGGDKFVIIGFPANNFLKQEPGTNDEIREFCTKNYGVTFPMMHKISVKGDDMDPIYQWLTQKSLNGVMDADVAWNFQKFMVDENGKLVGFLKPKESVNCEKVDNWIGGK